MTDYELYSFEAFRKHLHDDERPVERASMSTLDANQLQSYLLQKRLERPGFAQLPEDQALEMLNVTRDGKPTLAAVMNFCVYPQGYLPQLAITAVVVPGLEIGEHALDDPRFLDNKRIEGTIKNMVEEAIQFCKRNMKVQTIIDPETGEHVPDGEVGELVLTTLDREMMPLIRYRTRDLTRILPGECPCGRTHLRIDRIKGRSDDMFIIKGVNIFPMQVEKILVQFPALGSNYLITLQTRNNQDEMVVEVELRDLSTDNYVELEEIRKKITQQLKDEILVTPKVRLVKKGSLPHSEGKAVRVKDLRSGRQ